MQDKFVAEKKISSGQGWKYPR